MNQNGIVNVEDHMDRYGSARARWALALLIALLTLVASCASGPAAQEDAGPTREFQADNGTVTIPVQPKRVIAIGYAVPTLLEAGTPLVGISDFARALPFLTPEQRKTYDSLPRVAGDTNTDINYEAIAALKPDLIVLGVPKVAVGGVALDQLTPTAPVVAIGPLVPSDWRNYSRQQADAAASLAGFDAARTAYEARAAELRTKYQRVLPGLKFGHVGSYGQIAQGTFQREYANSGGTNIAQDIGVNYYGQVREPGPGARAVSEYTSLEELVPSLGQADAITYSVNPDGSVPDPVKQVLDTPLWATLPGVKAKRTFPLRLTEATTYGGARATLDAIDTSLAPLLKAPR
ncbi:TroA family protein [Pseudonocardia phyllosphaerae]|uniref:ABC transporter substrate-binding protein n=1 Tax=Pseudonocardia phyllosphaerae TaxID=3390502 RepID=UPI00397A5D77